MVSHLRFKDLPSKNFGLCERCGQKAARFYAITETNKATPADYVCRDCVGPEAVEIPTAEDIYA